MDPDSRILERLFSECFANGFRTVLIGGGEEPLYVPSGKCGDPHVILYREDYFASALHEVAHWCLAGAARRKIEDYGYWYAPDGRDAEQQAAFERAERRPQALEWIFSEACGFPFSLSADNLEAGFGPSASFQSAVEQARVEFLAEGLPPRAERFEHALRGARGEIMKSRNRGDARG